MRQKFNKNYLKVVQKNVFQNIGKSTLSYSKNYATFFKTCPKAPVKLQKLFKNGQKLSRNCAKVVVSKSARKLFKNYPDVPVNCTVVI